MGQKQSKGKGKGKGKSEDPPASAPNNEAPAKTVTPAAAPSSKPAAKKKEESNVDWDAPTLYSGDNQKVTKDDFELLKVIGKGSFGKVSLFI